MRVRWGKEEGGCGYGVFAALTETAETEWSRLFPGGPIEAGFDGEEEEGRSTAEETAGAGGFRRF